MQRITNIFGNLIGKLLEGLTLMFAIFVCSLHGTDVDEESFSIARLPIILGIIARFIYSVSYGISLYTRTPNTHLLTVTANFAGVCFLIGIVLMLLLDHPVMCILNCVFLTTSLLIFEIISTIINSALVSITHMLTVMMQFVIVGLIIGPLLILFLMIFCPVFAAMIALIITGCIADAILSAFGITIFSVFTDLANFGSTASPISILLVSTIFFMGLGAWMLRDELAQDKLF